MFTCPVCVSAGSPFPQHHEGSEYSNTPMGRPSDGQSLRGWWWSGEGVILNMATESETAVNMFHSLDRDMAPQSKERFRRTETLPRNKNLALQALASFESLLSDAIESFAAEIFGDAFNRRHSSLPQQTHLPMQWYPLAFAAISR